MQQLQQQQNLYSDKKKVREKEWENYDIYFYCNMNCYEINAIKLTIGIKRWTFNWKIQHLG